MPIPTRPVPRTHDRLPVTPCYAQVLARTIKRIATPRLAALPRKGLHVAQPPAVRRASQLAEWTSGATFIGFRS